VQTDDEAERLEGRGLVRILLRAEAQRVGRIRAVSEDCPLDAGGLPLVWIEGAPPAESVALLATFVGQPREGREGKRLDGAVAAAIAFHADPSADAALERFMAPGEPLELRKQAAFWMGQARGERGYQVLKRLVREDADRRFREHAIFALSQSHEPGAIDTIIEAARLDADGHVRGQALFWLAQTASRRAPDAIRAAVDNDPEIGVKKKAVFALSQLPKDEGVPLLVSLARTHQSHEVRKQAMFWLGQSGDPRALAFFEDVLKP
jgi:HEAT repeat protein